MHRVVIFSEPVTSSGVDLYGKLYSGATEDEILNFARFDYRTLLVREKFETEHGEAFRQSENWIPFRYDEGSGWWKYDKKKYTYNLGYKPIPDQFAETIPFLNKYLAILSCWVPLKIVDTNNEDYIINEAFYESVIGANPNNILWMSLEPEDDDLPF